MKTFRPMASAATGIVSLLVLGWLSGGCVSSSSDSSAPKPGQGIAEYRGVVRLAHRSVAAAVDSLEALPRSFTPPSTGPALVRFDRALHELELTSVKARARAEAIIARGQAYFDEWKGHLAGLTNQAVARSEAERYNRLHEHFLDVRERSGQVREEFRPFMGKLREFRARLDRAPSAAGEPVAKELNDLTAAGRRVLQALESIATALDEAEVELQATLAAKR